MARIGAIRIIILHFFHFDGTNSKISYPLGGVYCGCLLDFMLICLPLFPPAARFCVPMWFGTKSSGLRFGLLKNTTSLHVLFFPMAVAFTDKKEACPLY
jgi:hypothetical protein